MHYPVQEGRLSADTSVVMPTGVYRYEPANTLTVVAGQIQQQDFTFWQCLLY